MSRLPYKHTQPGTVMRWSLLAAMVLVVVVGSLSARAGEQVPAMICGGVLVVLAVCLCLFHSLTVEVTRERLAFAFGPGLVRRGFAVADLAGAGAVRNRWFYGWGIRLTLHGWLYNVSGLDAVEIRLRSGRRYRIGTDEPAELEAAIREAMAGS